MLDSSSIINESPVANKMPSLFPVLFDTQMFDDGICDPRRTVDHTGRDWLPVAGETSGTAIEVLAIACSVYEPMSSPMRLSDSTNHVV